MQKRRWGSYKKGSAAAASQAEHAASADPTGTPFHQQPEHKSTLRSQLAGLRHRAAVRGNKKGPRYAGAAAADGQAHMAQDDAEQQEQAEAMDTLEYDSTEMSDGCNMASGETRTGRVA